MSEDRFYYCDLRDNECYLKEKCKRWTHLSRNKNMSARLYNICTTPLKKMFLKDDEVKEEVKEETKEIEEKEELNNE